MRISGSIAVAMEKARAEYEKYRALALNAPSPVEVHFQEAIEQVKKLENRKRKKEPRKNAKNKKR